jgi:DNA-binding PadR family transcriptional regulator
MPVQTALDGLVLAALDAHGRATGRAISRAAGKGVLLYPTLRRLERDGLVSSVPLVRSTRRQRLYRLTRAGEEAMAVWRLVVRSAGAAHPSNKGRG